MESSLQGESEVPPVAKKKSVAKTGFSLALLFVLAITAFFFANFKTVVVSGESMEPTFKPHDRVLASKAYWLVGSIQRKDVVVLRNAEGNGFFIKRVLGVGGDEIDAHNAPSDWSLLDGPYIVPEGHIYVIGDNADVSEDSRKFGPVSLNDVIGKVVVRQ